MFHWISGLVSPFPKKGKVAILARCLFLIIEKKFELLMQHGSEKTMSGTSGILSGFRVPMYNTKLIES